MSGPCHYVSLMIALVAAAAGQASAAEPTLSGGLSSELRMPPHILESDSPGGPMVLAAWHDTVLDPQSDGQMAPSSSASPSDTKPAPEVPVDVAAPSSPRVASRLKPKPVPSPHEPLFYDNDFSYLDAPGNTHCYFGDVLKRRWIGCMSLDVGGEYRLRQHDEHMPGRTSNLRATNFLLQRTRLYGDLRVSPWLRVYGEAIDATSAWEDVAPRPIEENRFDALNLFGDARLYDGCCADLWFRGGRQELLYGAERLVSPFDWSNTRRTFDGLKLFYQGPKWDIDAFWTRPVGFRQHVPNDHNFDHPDITREFMGFWFKRKGLKNDKIDLYYLRLAEWDAPADVAPDSFNYDTLGIRWEGVRDNWLGEIEAGYQTGRFGGLPHSAGFYTIGGGRKLARLPWNPVLWVYYDWATGDKNPTDGSNQTFNQLFPLGHKYFGWMDLVGRQNIEDWNFRLTLAPHKKVDFIFWWHVFHLQQARDALYNAGGVPIRHDVTGAAGRDVGQEADFLVKYKIKPRADVIFGYSHLFPGDFLAAFPFADPIGRDFYYTQFSLRF